MLKFDYIRRLATGEVVSPTVATKAVMSPPG
jgi:hypothetical protein